MTALPEILKNPRIQLLGLSGLLALVLGFLVFPADLALNLVIHGGYWAMLLLTLFFAWSLLRLVRDDGGWPVWWESLRQAPRWPALLIATGGMILLMHEAYGFKILMDEIMLLGTSMSMHFEKAALVPMRGNDIQGAFQLLSGQLDKRPLFQPFLVSILHDLTGYRPENVFVLNTGLTFVLLGLAYQVAARLAGRAAGALAVLLLTSLPLLAQNATGGGFEVLNLVMILATLRLGMRFAEKRDAGSLTAFTLAGILLANTRYESVLFLAPVAALVIWVWWREPGLAPDRIFLFSPLYLLPYALHHQVFTTRASSWELASQAGYDRPFSTGYIADNIIHALNFFFNTNGEQSNSLVLAVLGLPALPFFLLWAVKVLRAARTESPARLATALFALGFAAHTALMLCYFWGKFDDPVIRRLSLPLNLCLVLAVVAVAAEFGRERRWLWPGLIALTGTGLFAFSLPAMARHGYTLDYYIGRETDWRREFIASHPERDYLFIDNSSIVWITHLVSATPMIQATMHKENL
ncbi:MAG: glycosyltransferase family 39 protein, partial [Desulfobaccales bacterium]